MESEQRQCPQCGAAVSPDSLVCPHCAADLGTPTSAPTMPAPEPMPTIYAPAPPESVSPEPEPRPPTYAPVPAEPVSLDIAPPEPEEPLPPPPEPPPLAPTAEAALPALRIGPGGLPDLGAMLPPGTLTLDLDQVAAAALNRPPAVDLAADVADALAQQLPPSQQDAAPALASYLLVTLEAQTRMTKRSVVEELQELARGQSTLEVEISEEGGRRRTQMRLNTRHTMGMSPGEMPTPPTWRPPEPTGKPGCRVTCCCAPTALALLALLLGLALVLWR